MTTGKPSLSNELLPCPNPWCDHRESAGYIGPTLNISYFGNSYVECMNCGASSPAAESAAEAVAKWNTRPAPTYFECPICGIGHSCACLVGSASPCSVCKGEGCFDLATGDGLACSECGRSAGALALDWEYLRDVVMPPPFYHSKARWTVLARLITERVAVAIRALRSDPAQEARTCPHGSTGPCSVCGDMG